MKPGYTIKGMTSKTDKFFYLFNFKPFNEISIFGFHSERRFSSDYLVGVWKIKQN